MRSLSEGSITWGESTQREHPCPNHARTNPCIHTVQFQNLPKTEYSIADKKASYVQNSALQQTTQKINQLCT